MLYSCWHWWKLHRRMRFSDHVTLGKYHLEDMLIISGIHRLIHFSNRCAPNITNPPQYCFFSLPPPPIIPSHLNAKPQNNPNHKCIHPSFSAGCLLFCLVLLPGKGRSRGKMEHLCSGWCCSRILGLVWGCQKARHCCSGCPACSLHQWAQPEAAWEMETCFCCFCSCKIQFSLVSSGERSASRMESWPLPACLAHGIFSL